MLIESAVVIEERGDRAVVKTHRGEACDGCHSQGACRALGGGKDHEFEVLNLARAKVGDRVELALPEASLLKASIITYLIPLVCLMIGAVLGQTLSSRIGWSANAASVIFGAIGVAVAMLGIYIVNKKIDAKDHYTPSITRILPKTSGNGELLTAGSRPCGS